MGETTFSTLSYLLTDYKTMKSSLNEAINIGDNRRTDMLVKDIYGEVPKFQLSNELLASSFGKLSRKQYTVERQDISRSLITLIVINISQICSLLSTLHNIPKVLFIGSKIQNIEFYYMLQVISL